MSLSPSSRVGIYEIVGAIGAGGMGEVFRARDTTLNRDVALKVLPALFSGDPDRLGRFRREAQTLAALNHPNVAQIYGVEDSAGLHALAMEFVPGRTLEEIIRANVELRRPSSDVVPWALPIARQIVDALEAAHDAGIVHRDLKPANIKVRDDGTVKVLDFGLAKAVESDGIRWQGSGSGAPTMTSPALTGMGIILGTAAYMAPEQATGRPVDKRADIWAFGCVLYEILTGERLFAGDTVQETLASVIKDPVRFDRLPPEVPRHVRHLLVRCLDRDPRTRLRDMGEARVALAREDDSVSDDSIAAGGHTVSSGRGLWWLAAISVLMALITGFVVWQRKPAAAIPTRRFELPAAIASSTGVAIAPDGTRLAYFSKDHLWVHSFADGTAQDAGEIPPASVRPFWSPDGRTIGFGALGDLRTRPATGGPDFVVCKLPGSGRLMGAAWRPDNTIVFSAWRDSLYSVPAAGGAPATLVAANPATDIDFHEVDALPDGRLIVARHVRSDDNEHLEIVQNGRSVPLTEDRLVGNMRYMPPGFLVFVRRGANKGVWAVPFDKAPIDFGRAVLIAAGATSFVAAEDGTLVYFVDAPTKSELIWVTRGGTTVLIPGAPVELYGNALALSGDGRRAAVLSGAWTGTILSIRDLQTGVDTRLTVGEPDEAKQTKGTLVPSWSPAGNRVLYASGSAEATKILSKDASGAGTARELVAGFYGQISANGRDLYYVTDDRGRWRLWHAPIGQDGTVGKSSRVFQGDDLDVGWFDLSSDGALMAYELRQTDRKVNVWLTDLPDAVGRWQVTTDGGTLPRFSHDGRELFHLGPDHAAQQERQGALFSVPVTLKPTIKLGVTNRLFAVDQPGGPSAAGGYDVAPDGRLLFSRTAASAGSTTRAVFVQNWLAGIAK